MSKQQERQNAVRLLTGTAYTYADDWNALFDADAIAEGPFSERLKNWINATLGASYQNLNDAMRAFAIDQGYTRWNEMGDFIVGARITLSAIDVSEDASIGDLVGTLAVVNGSGSYTFSITADPDSKFVLDVGDNTRLELEATLDFETDETHSVTISADNGVDDPITRTFTIYVTNVVEIAGPVFTSGANQSVAENEPFSFTLTTNEPCTFTVVGGADAGIFDIADDAVEALEFDFETPADADNDNVYEFTVRATSIATGLTTDLVMTLTVTDVAEAWSPADLGADLIAWWDASNTGSLTLSGSEVTQWNDLSGNARHVSQSIAGRYPVYSATAFNTSYPGLNYVDSDDSLISAAFTGSAGTVLAAFAVARLDSGAPSNARLISWGLGFPGDDVATSSVAPLICRNGGTAAVSSYRGAFLSSSAITYGNNYRLGSVYDGTNHTIYINNTAGTPAASTGSFNNTDVVLGIGTNTGFFSEAWKGVICEVFVCKVAPDSTTRTQIDDYFKAKWGLS